MNSDEILLGVNIDHVATLRQTRYRETVRTSGTFVEPDPVFAALVAEQAGADQITVHPREDARHIQREDVLRLREAIKTRLNMEMACTQDMADFALKVKPDCVCIVPENRTEVTTEGGLDVITHFDRVRDVVQEMNSEGIKVSLFIDPDPEHIESSAELEADMVELHTGAFANHYYDVQSDIELDKLSMAAKQAHNLGLTVNAGHGINYVNIREILQIPHLHELNIGHSIISRAVISGLDEAVREMLFKIRGH